MDLYELAEYAAAHYNMKEQHKWERLPGLSVLEDPVSGKWIALLMSRWDSETGDTIETCDIRCGEQIPEPGRFPFLSKPFRMKGQNWIGVRMEELTDREVVLRLFDRAAALARQQRNTIELGQVSGISRGFGDRKPDPVFKETPLPAAEGRHADGKTPVPRIRRADKEIPEPWSGNADMKNSARESRYTDTGIPAPGTHDYEYFWGIPKKIRQMQELYEYGGASFKKKCRNFYVQGKFMEDYEDEIPWTDNCRQYFTTYHDLNIRQQRGYFTWRAFLRKGDFRAAPLSYAYLYLYELLSCIGAGSPEDALLRMQAFEKGFLDAGLGDGRMRENLHRWMFDFCLLRNLDPETARKYDDPQKIEWDTVLSVLKEPAEKTDEQVFGALAYLYGKKLPQSSIVRKDKDKGMHLFASLWRTVSEKYSEKEKDIFTACFGEKRTYPFHPLENAIHWEEGGSVQNAVYELDGCRKYICRDGSWQVERYSRLYFNRDKFNGLIHEADRMFRKYYKTGHYLKKKDTEAWAQPFAREVLEEEKRAEIEAARPKITIDFSDLEQIRRDAAVTRDSLLTEEETEDTMLPDTRKFAGREICSKKPEPGESVLSGKTGAGNTADVSDEAGVGNTADISDEAGAGNTADISDEAGAGKQGNLSGDAGTLNPSGQPVLSNAIAAGEPAGAAENADFLTGDENLDTVLRSLLHGESVNAYIKEHHLFPSVVADAINEALFDEIGDNVLEYDGSEIAIVEDYREDLEELMGAGNPYHRE